MLKGMAVLGWERPFKMTKSFPYHYHFVCTFIILSKCGSEFTRIFTN